jgi:serine/threonine protein kinase
MAPEVLQNIKYPFSADVWSTGAIFYELIMQNCHLSQVLMLVSLILS